MYFCVTFLRSRRGNKVFLSYLCTFLVGEKLDMRAKDERDS